MKLIISLILAAVIATPAMAEPQKYDAVMMALVEGKTMEELAKIEEIVSTVLGCDDIIFQYLAPHPETHVEDDDVEDDEDI